MKFEGGYFGLDQLITRIFSETMPPGKIDAAYLYAETADQETSGLKTAAFLYAMGPAKRIALCGEPKGYGYPGAADWIGKLVTMGLPKKDIYLVPVSKKFPPSTHAEAFGLIPYAAKQGWKSVYVVAPPLHQLRAFVTTVSAIIKERSRLKAYSFPGLPQRWEEHVIHSQGVQKGARSELLAEELKKIEKYFKKGDLVSAREVLKYLDKRDGK